MLNKPLRVWQAFHVGLIDIIGLYTTTVRESHVTSVTTSRASLPTLRSTGRIMKLPQFSPFYVYSLWVTTRLHFR